MKTKHNRIANKTFAILLDTLFNNGAVAAGNSAAAAVGDVVVVVPADVVVVADALGVVAADVAVPGVASGDAMGVVARDAVASAVGDAVEVEVAAAAVPAARFRADGRSKSRWEHCRAVDCTNCFSHRYYICPFRRNRPKS